MKKTLSLILALLMSASCASYIFADEADVEATAAIEEEAVVEEAVEEEEATEYDDALKFLTLKNIMHGMEDGLLHAELGVERYQMALFVGRVSTGWVEDSQWEDGIANDSQFEDLAGTAAENVYGAISYVNQKGIIEGYEDGTFKPEKGVTYREALTMAVRTLEYQGLDYPWGYIEKAIGLGLTDGISGVAYTDEIDRGVAAQIVYNMLFADTKSGDTLAMRSFGVEFGWQNIIITANNKSTYEAGADTTKNVGVVGFKVINEDGTLGDETYYLNEDLAIGSMYNALFELNDDKEFVDIVGAHEYVATVIENKGLTDDEAVAYEDADPIGTFLKDYTLVDKYGSSILANSNLYRNELIVVNGYDTITVLDKYDYSGYAIDWSTGDILKKIVDKDDEDEDGDKEEYSYEVEWFWNADYEYYFRYQAKNVIDDDDRDGKYDYDIDKIAIIGYDIMDDKDLAELKNAIAEASKVTKDVIADGYKTLTEKPGTTAYALLATYDLNGDDEADYATYEAYRLAKFQSDGDIKVKCDKCDKEYANAYQFTGLDLTNLDRNSDVKFMPVGACDHYSIKDGKIGERYNQGWEFAADSLIPENDDIVIYGVNEATNELKVVKIIEKLGDNTDADSYIATGVVRGYSYKNEEVTIGDDNLKYDYSTLNGTAFVKVGDKKTTYSDALSALLNQFVTYIVVDGKLVYVEATGGDNDTFIVVESYAGIDSDGYIVVNGYNTDTLEYDQFRIGSYNNWVRGDFVWYKDVIEDEFVKGAVYKISSSDVDAENGVVYYVQNLGVDVDDLKPISISFSDGYRVVSYDGKTETKRMSSDDKYIIIGATGDAADYIYKYMPIYVYEGKVNDTNWYINGDCLVGKVDASTFIIVNPTAVKGFDMDTTKTGFVAVLDKTITEVNHGGYGKDYYIYGQTTYTVEVFNLLSGKKDETRVGANIDLEEGRIYTTIDDTVIDMDGMQDMKWNDFKKAVTSEAYKETALADADYRFIDAVRFSYDYIDGVNDKDDGDSDKADHDDKKEFSKEVIAPALFNGKNYYDLVGDLKIYLVDVSDDGEIVSISDIDKKGYNKKFNSSDIVDAFVVYNVKDEKAVVYLEADNTISTTVTTDPAVKGKTHIEFNDDACIDVTASVTTTKRSDVGVTNLVLNSLTFDFNGDATKGMHSEVLAHGYNFGNKGTCDVQAWHTTLLYSKDHSTLTLDDEIYTDIVTNMYDDNADDDKYDEDCVCKLVEGVTVTVNQTLEVGKTHYARLEFAPLGDAQVWSLPVVIDVDNNGKVVVEIEAWEVAGWSEVDGVITYGDNITDLVKAV